MVKANDPSSRVIFTPFTVARGPLTVPDIVKPLLNPDLSPPPEPQPETMSAARVVKVRLIKESLRIMLVPQSVSQIKILNGASLNLHSGYQFKVGDRLNLIVKITPGNARFRRKKLMQVIVTIISCPADCVFHGILPLSP